MKFIVFIIILLPIFSISGKAEENIVNEFIKNQAKDPIPDMVSDNEIGELNSYFKLSETLIAIHWTFKVANFWQERVSILKIDDTSYTAIDNLKIDGVTQSVLNTGNKIIIINKSYAKEDPRCCPSILVESIYEVTVNGIEKYNKTN